MVTVGWNRESPWVASGNVSFEGKPIPMLGEVPDGDAIFFLKKFPDIPELGLLAGAYEVVGQHVGRIPLSDQSSLTNVTDDARTADAGISLHEFAGRDLRGLAQDLRSARDAFEASEVCEMVVASTCPAGPGVTYIKTVDPRTRPDGTLEYVRQCCRYPHEQASIRRER